MALSRRTFVKYGLAGTVLLAVGSVGLAMRGTVLREPKAPLKVLSLVEYSILAAVADRIAPRIPGIATAADLQVAEAVDEALSSMHPGNVADFKRLLHVLENALLGAVFESRVTTFTGSSPQVQDAILESWRVSSLTLRRVGFCALQGLCSAAIWGNERMYQHCGYPGPPDFSLFFPVDEDLEVPSQPSMSEDLP